MESDKITAFKDIANQFNWFFNNYGECIFPEPSEFMNYLNSRRGKMVVIGSRPAHGKTGLMLSLIREAPQTNVLVFSLEYSSNQLLTRFMRTTGEINPLQSLDQISNNAEQPDNRHQINTERSFSIYDQTPLSFDKFISVLAHQQRENHVEMVFVDYYQLLDETPNLLYKMKKCAEMFHITIVVFSQLCRMIDAMPLQFITIDSFPRLNDVENIDEAYYLVRPQQYKISHDDKGSSLENVAIIYCLKGKLEKRKVIFKFDRESSSFVKASSSQFYNNKLV